MKLMDTIDKLPERLLLLHPNIVAANEESFSQLKMAAYLVSINFIPPYHPEEAKRSVYEEKIRKASELTSISKMRDAIWLFVYLVSRQVVSSSGNSYNFVLMQLRGLHQVLTDRQVSATIALNKQLTMF